LILQVFKTHSTKLGNFRTLVIIRIQDTSDKYDIAHHLFNTLPEWP